MEVYDPLGISLTDMLNINGRNGWEYVETFEREAGPTGKRRILLRRELP